MPTYVYECGACKHTIEKKQAFADKPLKKCPECKKLKLYRVIFSPHINIIGEAKTLGQQASRNTKKLGHYEKESLEHEKEEHKANLDEAKSKFPGRKLTQTGDRPWWRKNEKLPDKSLTKLTKEQKHKYILTGEK